MPPRTGYRYEMRHYCRHCLAVFPATPGKFSSAHARYLGHLDTEHPDQSRGQDQTRHLGCGKYCFGREQADEKQHGVKLYGPGSTSLKDLVPLVMTYEQIFPEEKD